MKLKRIENCKILSINDVKFLSKDVERYVELIKNISSIKGGYDALPIIKKWEKIFFRETNRLLSNADSFAIKKNHKDYIKKVKSYFREILKEWMCKGKIVKRGFEKPRGYPGDYFTLEMIYDEKDVANNILGILFDKYLLKDSYVMAVRNRKEKMKILIQNYILQSPKNKRLRFLNIAAGGARDVREFLVSNRKLLNGRNIEMVLVDQDSEALSFAKKKINLLNSSINVSYLNENIAGFFRNQDVFRAKLKKFDMIYSIGLIDYISDLLLEELIKFSFELLNIEGVLFLAVKNTKAYKSLASDWFCDWNFYLRDQNDLISLIKKALKGRKFKIRSIKGFDNHITFVSVIKE